MKSILYLFIFSISILAGCKKNDVKTGPGGSGGNGKDTLSITGTSPQTPYFTDEITINGTGFNTDKTKDTVTIVIGRQHGYLNVDTATASQLKVSIPSDILANLGITCRQDVAIAVSANGQSKTYGSTVTIIPPLQILQFENFDAAAGALGPRPGDSVVIVGKSYTSSGAVFSIDGHMLNNVSVNALGNGCYAYGNVRLPKSLFGGINNEDSTAQKTTSITNGDGKVAQVQSLFYLSPKMEVDSIYFAQRTYSLTALNNSGGKITLYIFGKSLKNNTDVEFTGPGIDQHTSLGVSGFPDSTSIQFGPGSLTAYSTYIVWVRASNTSAGIRLYGAANFSTTP